MARTQGCLVFKDWKQVLYGSLGPSVRENTYLTSRNLGEKRLWPRVRQGRVYAFCSPPPHPCSSFQPLPHLLQPWPCLTPYILG